MAPPPPDRRLDAMSDGALMRLMLSDKFNEYATWIARKKADGVSLSSGEQRLVNILCNFNVAYDFWTEEQWAQCQLRAAE
jgi:hypothetical protein